jgi:methionine-rich copper-binding protein CopC
MLVGVTQISTEIPDKFELYQNYPNPFNPVTKIKFSIPSVGNGRDRSVMKIYNALGREVEVLVNQSLLPGTYEVDWDASSYPSGVYFCEFVSGNFTQTRKMVLLK